MKKTYKSIFVVLAMVMLLLVALTGCAPSIGTELVANGDFEKYTDGATSSWKVHYSSNLTEEDARHTRKSTHGVASEESKEHGASYIQVKLDKNTGGAYYTQEVKLYAGKTYEFDFDYWIVSNLSTNSSKKNAAGVFAGFLEGDYSALPIAITTTNNEWVSQKQYIKVDTTATYTLALGIGRENIGGATGTVAFDNISLKEVDPSAVPAGTMIGHVSPSQKITPEMVGGVTYTVIFTILGAVLMVAAYYLIRQVLRKNIITMPDGTEYETSAPEAKPNDGEVVAEGAVAKAKKDWKKILTSPVSMFVYVLLATLAARVIMVSVTVGMTDYLANYGKLALSMASDGFGMAYTTTLNVPAGYLYVLYVLGLIGQAVGLTASSVGMGIMLRTPNIIADLVIAYLIFSLLNKHYHFKYSALIAGVFALNPLFFTASSSYGLNFSIGLAFIIGMLMFMLEKKHIGAISMYTLAFIFDNTALILLPLIIGYDIYYCVKDKKAILPIILSSVVAVIVFYLVALPFTLPKMHGTEGMWLVFTNILADIKTHVVVSESAFNFFAMCGMASNGISITLSVVVAVIMALFVALACYMYYRSKNRLDFIYIAAMSLIVWTVFGEGVTLQTMIMGIALLLIYAGIKGEKRIFTATSVLSITSFVNIAVLMTRSGAINIKAIAESGYAPFYALDPLMIVGSVIAVLCVLYLVYVGLDIMLRNKECDIRPMIDNYFANTKDNIVKATNKVTNKVKNTFKGN